MRYSVGLERALAHAEEAAKGSVCGQTSPDFLMVGLLKALDVLVEDGDPGAKGYYRQE